MSEAEGAGSVTGPVGLSTCAVVGIGASAGGLNALRRLLSELPPETSFAIVVVQHLDPSTRSRLAEIIEHSCGLQVKRARSGDTLTAGTVYVVPEGREAFLDEGRLRLKQRTGACSEPIDAMFTSLAAHNEASGCGVLLSGNGADGVLGLREIRGAGGMTFAQEPSTAEYPSMPATAIEAGVADFIGSPEQIARDLMAHVRHAAIGGPPVATRRAKAAADRDAKALAKILGLVRIDSGMDFSGYKTTTVMRRVNRRAMLLDAPSLEAYLALVEADPGEVAALVDDLLINVTQFFRDAEVFGALRGRVFPELIKTKSESDTLRIWVVGCSTGEEVYSLLITALEAMEDAGIKRKVTVFGTDASEAAVRRARAGLYPPSICAAVSPERLAKYFVRTDNGFEIDRALRDMCVFARQDITKDTPFSRLDLVSLRNVLIYMDQTLQGQVLAVAHFALAPDGVLVLGTSETPEIEARLFGPVDKQHHVYRRQDVASRLPVDVANAARANIEALSLASPTLAFDIDVHDAHLAANEMALILYAPPRVVIDANGHVLHFFGETSPYLEHAPGRATLDVNEMAQSGIALELKDAIEAAKAADGRAVRTATFAASGHAQSVSIEVTPLPSPPGQSQFMVAFREVTPESPDAISPATNEDLSRLYEAREQRVRGELGAIRGRLRTIAEEKEQVNQSLRTANEEIRSSNEELQSINEEVETAKEELQSANEELITVNDELRLSNRDLGLVNDDLTNFTASIDVPVLMLDRSLRVRRFTPQATRVVHIEESDVGRLLGHLRLRVDAGDLPALAAAVIASDEPRDLEVQDEDGHWFAMSLRPYRSAEGHVDGVVIAFSDIDELKRNADRLGRRARLNEALSAIDADLASTMDFDEIMQCALDDGVKALGVDAGAIEVRQGDGWAVRYQNGFGPDEVGSVMSETEAPNATRAARTGAPFMIADMRQDEDLNVGFVKAHRLKSAMVIPLTVRSAVIGALLFYRSKQALRFTSAEMEFGRRLGTAVSLALENSRLLHAERDAAQRAETLNAINETVRSAITPDELLGRLVGEVSLIAGADKSLVVEVRGEELVVTHVRNMSSDPVGKPHGSDVYPAFALAAKTPRPLLIGDTYVDKRTNKDFVVTYGLRALQLLPLVADAQVVAVLALAYDTPREFTAQDERFASRVSTAMSVALKNARLYQAEQDAHRAEADRAERTALLNEIAELAASSLDVHAVASRVVEGVHRLLGAEQVQIRLLNESGETLESLAVIDPNGYLSGLGPMPVDARLETAACFRDMDARFGEDVARAHVTKGSRRNVKGSGVRAYALLPLVSRGESIGTFFVGWLEPRSFTAEDKSFFESVAAQFVVGLTNARLYESEVHAQEEANRQLDATTLLLRTAEVLAEPGDLATRLGAISELVSSALVHDRVVVNLWDAEAKVVTVVAAAGGDRPAQDVFAWEELSSAGRRAIESGTTCVIDYGQESEAVRGIAGKAGFRLAVAVPMVASGRTVGLMLADRPSEAAAFEDREIELLDSVASQAALAVENERLFEAERNARAVEFERAKRVSVLKEIAEVAASSLSLDEVSERLVRAVAKVFGAARVMMTGAHGEALRPMAAVGFPEGFLEGIHEFPPDSESMAVFRSDGPRFQEDLEAVDLSEFASNFAHMLGGRSHVGMPLLGGGARIGTLSLMWAEARTFPDDELDFLASIAAECATGLQNAMLFESEREAHARVEALHELTELATSSLELSEVADRALHYVHDSLGVDVVTFWMLDANRARLFPVSGVGFPQAFYDGFAAGVGLDDPFEVATSVKEVRPIIRGVAHIDEVPEPVRSSYAKFGIDLQALLVLPVRGRADVIGAVTLAWSAPRDLGSDEVEFFSSVANELAIAAENANLYAAKELELNRTRTLAAVATASSSSLGLENICARTLDEVKALPDVAAAAVYVLETDRNVLRTVSVFGYPDDLAASLAEIPIDDTTNPGRVAGHSLEMLTHEDPGNPPESSERLAKMGIPSARWIALPLLSAGRLEGVIGLIFHGERPFEPQELKLFCGIADTLAAPLANARLFEAEVAAQQAATRELDTTTALLDAADVLARHTDLGEVVGGIADALLKSTGHSRVIVDLWDEETRELVVVASVGEVPYEPGGRWPIDRVSAAAKAAVLEKRTSLWDFDEMSAEDRGIAVDEYKMHLALYTPLVQQGRVLGMVAVDDPDARRPFSEREIAVIEGIAAQAGAAIEKARLFSDLQESRQRVSSVLESISDGFYALDRDWRFTYANAEAGRMIGTPHEELIGRTMGEVVGDPSVMAFQEQAFDPAMNGGTIVELERYFGQTGIWADVRVFPSPDGVSVYGRDITERMVGEEALRQARERSDLMATFLDESSQAFAVGYMDGGMGLVNRAYEKLTGYSAEELADVSWATKLTPPEYGPLEAERLEELERTGEPVRYEKEYVRKDGTRVPVELLVHLARGEDGEPLHYFAFVTDLTERKQRERLDMAFNEIRTTVGGTLEFAEIVEASLAAGASAMNAEAAELFIHSSGGWSVAGSIGMPKPSPSISASDAAVAVARLVAALRGPVAIEDTANDPRLPRTFDRRSGVRALVAAPLGLEGAEIGALAFYRHKNAKAFTPVEQEFMTRLARVVSLAIQNSRLYDRERTIAETLQDALLTGPESIGGIETAYIYRAASENANVGGDFCEVFATGDHECAIVVGDVSGKGIDAARLTSLIHDGIRAYALETSDPSEIMVKLNRLVFLLSPSEQYATVFLGTLDTDTGLMRYCTAGHPSPAVVSRTGASFLIGTRAPLLGAFAEADFPWLETVLVPGDRLVAFTDGVTEARRHGQLLGDVRLLKLLEKMTHTPVKRLPQRLFDKVIEYAEGQLHDDTVILSLGLADFKPEQ